MPHMKPEEVSSYDVVYAIRTGVTVLMQKTATLDCDTATPVVFCVSPDNPQDILIRAAERCAVLKGMKREHVKAAIDRGSIMFYEMQGEDVVRCTPGRYGGG
jgi:hypothetical protein